VELLRTQSQTFDPKLWLAAAALVVAGGCTQHTIEVKPIKVEPIHVTLDVNIRLDEELNDFFDFEDEFEKGAPTATSPESASTGTGTEGGVS